MNFSEMLIMCGPAGVPCDHSVVHEETGRAKNNHWMMNDNGELVARGADYTSDYDVASQDDYESGKAKPPRLMTLDRGVVKELTVTGNHVKDVTWRVADKECFARQSTPDN